MNDRTVVLVAIMIFVVFAGGMGSWMGIDTMVRNNTWDCIHAERAAQERLNQAQVDAVLWECPESQRIPVRNPITGEAGGLFYYEQPIYIAVEDVEAVVRRVLQDGSVTGIKVVAQ